MATKRTYPHTPDGRYFVVRGRLWRTSNPDLEPEIRSDLVHELMEARRAVKTATTDLSAVAEARARVDRVKRSLGERGPPWWGDGAPDFNRHLVANTPYAEWYGQLAEGFDLPTG
jgi:hypothetical protein